MNADAAIQSTIIIILVSFHTYGSSTDIAQIYKCLVWNKAVSRDLLAWYMSANAEGNANDSMGSATVSDGTDTVQHAVNTSSVVIFKQMTCSVTCKGNSEAVRGQIAGCMGTSQGDRTCRSRGNIIL